MLFNMRHHLQDMERIQPFRPRRPKQCAAFAFVLAAALPTIYCRAQSSGPRSPATTANDGSVGSAAWSTTAQSVSSNDSYATVSTKGISNYLKVTDFGFTIPSPSGVSGIQLDVERNSNGSSSVALLDAWSTGTTRSISAGTNRCLIVAYAQENGIDSRDITAMTYGTRAMTQLAEFTAGVSGGFTARIEVWALLESEIALASNTTIAATFGGYSPYEYCDVFTSAVFQHVDQITPMSNYQTTGAQGSTDPHQLATAFSTAAGSMAINLATCGNRDASNPSPNSNSSSYATAAGYTEGIDYYFANTSAAPNTGACFQVIHKAVAAAGTEQPSCDYNGTVNRYAIVGFCLQRARELDYSVKLAKGGTIGGSDLANNSAWPSSDAYATYGGSTSLWGRTWTDADINSTSFGAAIATRVQNGTARVDHMRITVWYYSSLPIELLDLRAQQDGTTVLIDWITATETDNDHFVVQRSTDGLAFEDIERVPGAGTSTQTLFYSARDEQPKEGASYYRLAQVDLDGTIDYSPIVTVDVEFDGGLVVAPNPSVTGAFTVYDISLESGQVAVFSSDMRLVRTHVGAGRDPVIHLEDLPDGTYVLMVREGDRVRTARVVKESRWR